MKNLIVFKYRRVLNIMNFIPKDKKFAKVFKFRFKNEKQVEHRSIRLIYGNYGLKAITPGSLT